MRVVNVIMGTSHNNKLNKNLYVCTIALYSVAWHRGLDFLSLQPNSVNSERNSSLNLQIILIYSLLRYLNLQNV